MTSERVLEILTAFGADAARWPADERGECLAQIARDPTLARARRDAAVLDAALIGWARAPLAITHASTDHAVVRALATIDVAPARPSWPLRAWRPFAGVALAAALLIGTRPSAPSPPPAFVAVQSQADADAFREVFTPTPDEEEVL